MVFTVNGRRVRLPQSGSSLMGDDAGDKRCCHGYCSGGDRKFISESPQRLLQNHQRSYSSAFTTTGQRQERSSIELNIGWDACVLVAQRVAVNSLFYRLYLAAVQ